MDEVQNPTPESGGQKNGEKAANRSASDPHQVRVNSALDLDKVLLPKKGPAPETLMRVNAGAVLEASAPAPQAPRGPATPEALQTLAEGIRKEVRAQKNAAPAGTFSPVGAPPPAPSRAPDQEPGVSAVRTYKGDIEETVRDQNVSMVSIAAAQAKRVQARGVPEAPDSSWRTYAMYGVGGALLVAALGLIAFVAARGSAPPSSTPAAVTAPLIYVDATAAVAFLPNQSATDALNILEAQRESVKLSLGLIERLDVVPSASTSLSGAEGEYPAAAFLGIVAPHVPAALLRALSDTYLLGVHSFDGNQPLLIFKTASYEQTYAGMLAWEPDMQADLSPLFVRTPRVRIPEEGSTTPPVNTQVVTTPFNDRIVENHDARVMQNDAGDILLLWSFVDRETLVITTNEYTLREIITRLKSPPIVPIPGQ